MLQSFDFINTGSPNDRILAEKTKTITFTPVLTSFLGTPPTAPFGIVTFYGPLVHIYVLLKGGNTASFGWLAGSTISVPIRPMVLFGNRVIPYNHPLNYPIDPDTGQTNSATPLLHPPIIVGNTATSPYIDMNDASLSNVESAALVTGWFLRN